MAQQDILKTLTSKKAQDITAITNAARAEYRNIVNDYKNMVLNNYSVIVREEVLNALYDAYGPNFNPNNIVNGITFSLSTSLEPRANYSPNIFNIDTKAMEDVSRQEFNQEMSREYWLDQMDQEWGNNASVWVTEDEIQQFIKERTIEPKRENFKMINPQQIFEEGINRADIQFSIVLNTKIIPSLKSKYKI